VLNSDDDVYEKLTGLKLDEPASSLAGLSKDTGLTNLDDSSSDSGLKNTPEEFFSAVSESVTKLCQHNGLLIKDLTSKGQMANLFPVVGGLALIRNKVWSYNSHLVVDGQAKPFEEHYRYTYSIIYWLERRDQPSTYILVRFCVVLCS
jgi:hypothetical protein